MLWLGTPLSCIKITVIQKNYGRALIIMLKINFFPVYVGGLFFALCSQNMQAVFAMKTMFPNMRIRKNKWSPLLFFLVLDSREDPWNVCKVEYIFRHISLICMDKYKWRNVGKYIRSKWNETKISRPYYRSTHPILPSGITWRKCVNITISKHQSIAQQIKIRGDIRADEAARAQQLERRKAGRGIERK